jgi:hypothetical protein
VKASQIINRPAEVDLLFGDPTKANQKLKLGREPTSVEGLATMMVEYDLELAKREKTLRDAGHKLPDNYGHDLRADFASRGIDPRRDHAKSDRVRT